MRVEEKGSFYLRADTLVVLPDSLGAEHGALTAPLGAALGDGLRTVRASEVDRLPEGIYIGTAADPGGLQKRKLRKYLDGIETIGDSGYRLEVEKNGIILAAGGTRGVWFGLQTLAQLIEKHGNALPYLRIRDWPVLGVRGVYLTTRPTEADLRAYAALKCTHVFLDSDDFYDLTGVRADAWRSVFENARKNFLEPVPVFSTLAGMDTFLRANPMMMEGRAVADRITLQGVDWTPLRYPNILAERPEDLRVTISGVRCTLGQDYWLESVPLEAPFLPERPHWRIRRELEGAIPNGAEVTVHYGFATDDSATLCFAAPESQAWLRSALERLIATLQPRAIHLDHGTIGRLNKDLRSQILGLDDPDFFVETLNQLESVIHDIDPHITLMMWADLLNPFQGARTYGLEEVAAQLPQGITLLGRLDPQTPGEAIARFEQLQPVVTPPGIAMFSGTHAAASAYLQMAIEYEVGEGGLIAPVTTPEAVAPLLEMAWGGLGAQSIWTRRLNRYFDVALTQPDFPTLRQTLVNHLNEATLRGDAPADAKRRFEDYCGRHLDVLYEDEDAFNRVKAMYALLVEYLELEERFASSGNEAGLRRLRGLVSDWQALEPNADADRYQRIQDTINDQQLFVPAIILFQEDLRYYRADRPQSPQFEIPVRPQFQDNQGEAIALLNLMKGQAAVRRIDFESVRLGRAALSGRVGDAPFEPVKSWTGEGLAGVRGPLLLPEGQTFEALQLVASSDSGQTILRDLHVYGAKEPAKLDCAYPVLPPTLSPTLTGRAWEQAPKAGAFLRIDTPRFAEAPTTVQVCKTRDDLYVGIQASDPRPQEIVADFTQHDAPLWQQESVEIWLQPKGRLPLRLIVSPLGTRYDSEAGDSGWDGDWEAAAARTDQGWQAIIRIPAEWLGTTPRGTTLPFNVVRNRHSVETEQSAWAQGYTPQPDVQWGELRFP